MASLLAVTGIGAMAATSRVSGTASYRERIALPPGAVFEAVLEDVSAADAPAVELGRATISDPGNPPFKFEITYDAGSVEANRTYSVRAQVSVGRRLMFVSDTMNPVLTGGAGESIDVRMIKVGETEEESRDAPAAIGAHGLRLPASFVGEMPCPDCRAVRFQVNLWQDQVFHLRREWVGDGTVRDAIGRWSVDPDSHLLRLRGAGESWVFRIAGPDRLVLAGGGDGVGDPVEGTDAAFLTALPELESFEPHLPLRGMLTYVGNGARFTECLTGRDYALVPDGDFAALEHAYLAAGAEADGPIMASFDGGIVRRPEGSPDARPKVMVERFVGIWPGETCERTTDKASLTNTYWKILRLGDAEVASAEGNREPNLILREDGASYTATVGCNQLVGRYELTEDRLSLGAGASTMMACPPPLDDWERRLIGVIEATVAWRIDGQTLELLGPEGRPLALFQAVYLY